MPAPHTQLMSAARVYMIQAEVSAPAAQTTLQLLRSRLRQSEGSSRKPLILHALCACHNAPPPLTTAVQCCKLGNAWCWGSRQERLATRAIRICHTCFLVCSTVLASAGNGLVCVWCRTQSVPSPPCSISHSGSSSVCLVCALQAEVESSSSKSCVGASGHHHDASRST